MAGYIPDNILDEIRHQADIVGIISEYIPLKKAGSNFKAVCPFHSEKTPSFMVSPAKQIYHCFGCGEGGNVFSFVMKYERLSFAEAVRKIAQKTGVKIPETARQDARKQSIYNQLYSINQLAADFYHRALLKSEAAQAAREYVRKRKYSKKTVEDFKLGCAPAGWRVLYSYLKNKGITDALMLKAGLITATRNNRYCDRFRNRLMFPIFNSYGKVIGFGGRVLDKNDSPKYLNTQETPVFNKRKNLYALDKAKRAITENDRVLIVEGYTDCIRAHEAGLREVVASLGTALTQQQIRELKRYSTNIVLTFDADAAGELASLRGLDILLQEGVVPKVLVLPAGYDPDKYISDNKEPAFSTLIDKAINLIDYKINLLLDRYEAKKPEAKARIAAELAPTLNNITDAVLKTAYTKKLAELLGVKEEDIRAQLEKHGSTYYEYEPVLPEKKDMGSIDMAEKILIMLMLDENKLIEEVKSRLKPDDFENYFARNIAEKIFTLYKKEKEVSASSVIDAFDEAEEMAQVIASMAMNMPKIDRPKKNIEDCIRAIKKRNIEKELEDINARLKNMNSNEAAGQSDASELMSRYTKLLKERKQLQAVE